MKPEDTLIKIPPTQSLVSPNNLKDALQLVANMTGEAKKAAADNPLTSAGKPKSDLKGAAKLTNNLKEEGIEAYKRGIVPKPTMEGGLKNNNMYVAANAALEGLKLSEQQSKSLPVEDNK